MWRTFQNLCLYKYLMVDMFQVIAKIHSLLSGLISVLRWEKCKSKKRRILSFIQETLEAFFSCQRRCCKVVTGQVSNFCICHVVWYIYNQIIGYFCLSSTKLLHVIKYSHSKTCGIFSIVDILIQQVHTAIRLWNWVL